MRILHIEDDEADAELVALSLRRAGLTCDIRLALSRRECLEALQQPDYQLVLSDSHGLDFDAAAVLDLMREHLPGVPLIFLSGSFEDADTAALAQAGVTECILKDDLDVLVSTLKRLFPDSAA